jgi:uncharacterized UPF0160 family protein
MKKLVTHGGNFHADDVFATAVLSLVFNGEVKIIRSYDKEVIQKGEIVYDVGRIYDPKKNKFDHHQQGGAGERENGVPYAAFGLIWKHFGEKLVSSREAWEKVDQKLVQAIDANDTGFIGSETKIDGLDNYVVDFLIKSFNPTWSESFDESLGRFLELVDLAEKVLKREIKRAEDFVKGKNEVEENYKNTKNKEIIILDKPYSWRDVLTHHEEPKFVIFPETNTGRFAIQAVPVGMSGYEVRRRFPEKWRGKDDQELENLSGISGSVFCHNYGYLCINETLEGAVEMAQKALKS